MASLHGGVLLKLLEEMDSDEQTISNEPRKPALLQVRSIIPVMAEGDLWPKQGFYLKVNDASHAMYVSLPCEHDEMILNNKLQLGHFIHVQRLESARPVPILVGLKLVPGRHPCVGTPEDRVPASLGILGPSFSDSDSKSENNSDDVATKPPPKWRSLSASKSLPTDQNVRKGLRCRSIPTVPASKCVVENKHVDVVKALSQISITCSDKDSDSDSSKSSASSRLKTRRSWDGKPEGFGEKLRSRVVKHEIRKPPTPRRACLSPYSSGQNDSSDDNASTCSSRRRVVNQASKVARSSSRQRITVSTEKREKSFNQINPLSPVNDRKFKQSRISWDALPSNLEKLGKEVLQHRDVALLAAVEALQEASAAERLIQCLSTYSELQLSKDEDPLPVVDKFLDFHKELANVRLISQSTAKLGPHFTSSDTEPFSPGSKEAVKLVYERKKRAASWIKAAVGSDLYASPSPIKPITHSLEVTKLAKRSSPTSHSKQKDACSVTKSGEIQVGLAAPTKENSMDWVKGICLCASADLANSLQGECNKWFLTYIEKFLDEVMSQSTATVSDCQIAGLMCQMKKVNEWLDLFSNKEGNPQKDGFAIEDDEIESCRRIRNKIYNVLLKHVERSAFALESLSTTSQD
ncbi:hypothetical protein MKX03_022513 [Papaver bracteatum]|nr:hypothetical protein MKX03_022513 [Papaver bracteatum]